MVYNLSFPLSFPLQYSLTCGGDAKDIFGRLKDCGALVARDSRLIDSSNTGRPILQGAAMSFDGATQSVTAAHLVGTETVVSSHGTSTPTVNAGSIAFSAGTCALLELSDGTLYEMQERQGSIAYDSSGAGNRGVYVNDPPSVTDNTIPIDPANERGMSGRMWFDPASNDRVVFAPMLLTSSSVISLKATFIFGSDSFSLDPGMWGYTTNSQTGFFLEAVGTKIAVTDNSGTLRNINLNVTLVPDVKYVIEITNEGGNWAIYINDIKVNTNSALIGDTTINRIGRARFKNANGLIYDVSTNLDGTLSSYLGTGNTDADWLDQIGSNDGTVVGGEFYPVLARSDDPSTDVLGNPTQWQGSAYPVRPVERQSNGRSFDGATQSVTFPSLIGTETVTSSFGTSTPTVSAGTISFTAGTCAGVTLSTGLVIPLSDELGVCYSTTGAVSGTYVGSPPVIKQDEYHFNISNGFSTTGGDKIPADVAGNGLDVNGGTLTNPARSDSHNGAETELDFYNVATDGGTTPAVLASGVAITDYTFGDSVSNPLFERSISSVLEDRHTLFGDVLTGDCLADATAYTT